MIADTCRRRAVDDGLARDARLAMPTGEPTPAGGALPDSAFRFPLHGLRCSPDRRDSPTPLTWFGLRSAHAVAAGIARVSGDPPARCAGLTTAGTEDGAQGDRGRGLSIL